MLSPSRGYLSASVSIEKVRRSSCVGIVFNAEFPATIQSAMDAAFLFVGVEDAGLR